MTEQAQTTRVAGADASPETPEPCGRTHPPTGKRCTLPARHRDGCRFADVPADTEALPAQRSSPASQREDADGQVCGALDVTGRRRCYRVEGHEGKCDYSPNFQLAQH